VVRDLKKFENHC